MAHDEIARHLDSLRLTGGHPIPQQFWDDYQHAPELLRWLVDRAAGATFADGAVYRHGDHDVVLGWFLDADELVETLSDTHDALPGDVLPIENDGGDNHLTVGIGERNAGQVFFHRHDAPLDRNLELVDESLEHFLLALRLPPVE